MNRHREDAAPPGVWLAVLVLVALFMLPLYGAFRMGWLTEDESRGNAASEWLRYRPDAGGTVVMAVGSSLLQSGVVHAELAVDDRSQWLLFNRGLANFGNFGGLLHSQWPVQPQVLVVQTDLFLTDIMQANPQDLKAFLSRLRALARPAMRWVLGRAPPAYDETPVHRATPYEGTEKWAQRLVNVYSRNPAEQVQVIDWLRLQQTRGSRVVLLDIPRSPSTEKAMGAALVNWRAEMQAISAQLQVPLLRYDGALTDADFYDGSHMAPSGRKPHTRWLQQKIQGLTHESP